MTTIPEDQRAKAEARLAMRIYIQLRPITEHGDETSLYVGQADELAAAIAEYVAAIRSKDPA